MNPSARTIRNSLHGRRRMLAALGLPWLLIAPLAASPRAPHAQESFTLTSAIPDDAFIVTGERFNPERQFLQDHWAEVFERFEASGIVEDLTELVFSKLGAEQQGEAERIVTRFSELCAAVDWAGFGAGEIAFAERFAARPIDERVPIIGAPDWVILCRTTEELTEQNFTGLRNLLDAMLREFQAASGVQLKLDSETRDGAELFSLNLLQKVEQAPPLNLSVGRRGDVLFFSMGEEFRDRMLALLAGAGDRPSMAESARFQEAFADLPEAEDSFEYVDLKALHGDLRELAESVFTLIGRDGPPPVQDRIPDENRKPEAVELARQGQSAYEQGDHEQALLLISKAHEADPRDSIVMYNMACMHALMGDQDQALYWLERSVEAGFLAPKHMRHDEDLKNLRAAPRYLAAVELAEEQAAAATVDGLAVARRLAERGLGLVGMFDHSAKVEFTEGRSTYTESITALAETATSNPFYRVIAGGRPIEDFARYLPVETDTFEVEAGIDLNALYSYVLDVIADLGPAGQQALRQLEGMQQEFGLDVRKDVFGWIDGAAVRASFQLEGADAWVWMMKVKDEQAAQEKLEQGLSLGLKKLSELSAEIPQLAMLSMRAQPIASETLPGFQRLTLVMAPQEPLICGVADGWLICGSSEDAVLLTLKTGRGEHPNARENTELMARTLVPEAPAGAVSFQDHTKDSAEWAGLLGSLSMVAGMASMAIPDPDAREAVIKVFALLSKLAPVVAAIDFYESTSSHSTFDGRRWHHLSVTHYTPPGP